MHKLSFAALLPAALLLGCSSSSSSSNASAPVDASTALDATTPDASPSGDAGGSIDASGIVAARPYTLHVPASYTAGTPAPLVVMFHGYSASGAEEESYLSFAATSDAHGFLYAYGNGLIDESGNRFWNATDACCNFWYVPVDDDAYFDAIVADVSAKYSVDPKRVYVIGHSNGGFMSHRLACDRAGQVAAIVSLEGAQWLDLTHCAPSEPVAVAEIHGTADTEIYFDGGTTTYTPPDAGDAGPLPFKPYPGASTTVADWATLDQCTGAIAPNGTTYDLVSTLPGNETQVQAYAGCPNGIDVQLWYVPGGDHVPSLSRPAWGEAVWGFLSAHAKP